MVRIYSIFFPIRWRYLLNGAVWEGDQMKRHFYQNGQPLSLILSDNNFLSHLFLELTLNQQQSFSTDWGGGGAHGTFPRAAGCFQGPSLGLSCHFLCHRASPLSTCKCGRTDSNSSKDFCSTCYVLGTVPRAFID